MLSKLYGNFIYPAIVKNRRRVPLPYSIGYAPTYGEALYIAILVLANVLAASLGHNTFSPTTSYPQPSRWAITASIANRCGMLAITNFMILALMAGRNNILLWLTNWQHSTYLLLHRWVAYFCILEALVHSLIFLARSIKNHNHAERIKSTYWIWGCVATVSFSAIFLFSQLPIRQRMYEVFLVSHVILALLALVSVWQHIWYKFTRDYGSFGFDFWIWMTVSFWALDHLIRYLRIAKNGMGKAEITVLDDEYIQINVRDIEVEGHVYLYFPTLTWRFWESHPFSVYASAIPDRTEESESVSPTSSRSQENVFSDNEKNIPNVHIESAKYKKHQHLHPGFSLLVRTMDGTTKHLRNRVSLPVLVEGSYHRPRVPSPACRLICVAGGVGITAVLPTFTAHQGSKKLYWGSRTRAMVEVVEPHLEDADTEILVGSRLDLQSILEDELAGPGEDVVVQVCGPASMTDDVRATLLTFVKKGERNIRLDDESFGW
jgi:hypothetical protein